MDFPDPLALVGTTVAQKYDVERVVGEGGFALVYRAMHKVWQRPVAIKVFRAMGGLAPEPRALLIKSFIQEGALLADLSERSAAICQARDVGVLRTKDGQAYPYMVLEWLEGRSLEQVITDETAARMPPRSALETLLILEPAAQALALAHRKGIAHRDVKPANLFVIGNARDASAEYTIKILDFGIAKVVQDVQREAGSFQQTQGVVSSFTPSYGAPEQFSRTYGATGPWTDVFALALIFTELMTHQSPLGGDDLTQLAFCSMDPLRRPTPRRFGVETSDALDAVLRRALAVSPDERFRSMGEFWDALRQALAMDPIRSVHGVPSRLSGVGFVVPGSAPSLPGVPDVSTYTPSFASQPGDNRGAVPIQSTMITADPRYLLAAPSVVAPRSASALPLAAAVAGGLALVAALGFGANFALRGVRSRAPSPEASSTPAAVVAVVPNPPAPTCPQGMVSIPGGKFFMGSDDPSDEESERPAHQVSLSPYCIDTTEVTVNQYKACSDKGECKRAPRDNEWPGITAREKKIYDPLCTIRDAEAHGTYPVNCVDWDLANTFCKASGKRLPSEAEWEFATRGSDGRKYPWGDEPPTDGSRLNACGKECLAWGKKHNEDVSAMYAASDGFETTAPVGSFPKGASPFGLQDVVGNVWEWASDWYADYAPGAATDPPGGSAGTERVLRGGAWNGSDPAWVRPTYRFKSQPALRSHGVGFRCAKRLE